MVVIVGGLCRKVCPTTTAALPMMARRMLRFYSTANATTDNLANVLSHDIYKGIEAGNDSRGRGASYAVFLHGILGSKRNWRSVCIEMNKKLPHLQSIAIDHRGHGQSSSIKSDSKQEETVLQCALDVSYLVHNHLKVSPDLLCAHSFGGKVALKYLQYHLEGGSSSSSGGSRLAEVTLPSDVWILDSLPGPYNLSNTSDNTSQSVKNVFKAIAELPIVFESSNWMIAKLMERGVEKGVAQWLATNIIPDAKDTSKRTWEFDIRKINLLFDDFCKLDMWPFLENYQSSSTTIHFLRAGKNKGWTPDIISRFESLQSKSNGRIKLHVMPHVGHWLHAEDMKGMIEMILANSDRKLL